MVYQAGLLTLVDAPWDLGDGLCILPAPGELPGHQVLQLRAGGIEAYFAGDLYHHPLEFAEPARNVRWATAEVMRASKAALIQRAAGSGARVFLAHIPGPCRVEWRSHTAGDSEGSVEWTLQRPSLKCSRRDARRAPASVPAPDGCSPGAAAPGPRGVEHDHRFSPP